MALEDELMALFGDYAPGADDPRRRRGIAGRGGYEGLGTPGINQVLPWLQGLRGYDFSGANIRDFGGGGIRSLMDLIGPGRSHLQGQGMEALGPGDFIPPGQEELPPGLDNRNAPGGANIAPGQPGRGLALGQPDVIGPHTQGWRNVAPGGAVAAGFGYGTSEFDKRLGLAGAGLVSPGTKHGEGIGGGGQGKGTGGPRTSAGPVSAPSGAAQAPTGGGGGGGGGGGNQIAGVRPGQQKAVKNQAKNQGTARGGGSPQNYRGSTKAKANLKNVKAANRMSKGGQLGGGGSSTLMGLAALGNTVGTGNAPNQGNNNTPSEMNAGGDKWKDTHKAKYANETPKEKKARLAAKAARQQVRAQQNAANNYTSSITPNVIVAPLSQAALQNADPRGSGTEPIKGKVKPKKPPRPNNQL